MGFQFLMMMMIMFNNDDDVGLPANDVDELDDDED